MGLSFREGDYLTDQRRLYQVLQIVPKRLGRRAAILEDCRTLETILFLPKELKRMRLELVRPASPPRRPNRRPTFVIESSPTNA
jgi:hypothetical protein